MRARKTAVATVEKVRPTRSKQAVATEPINADQAMLQMIAAAARDPKVNIEKMERLYELRERSQAAEAERASNTAMAAAQAKMVPVVRNRRNPHTSSDYADIAALHTDIMPLVHEGGFGLSFSEFQAKKPHHIGIACKVTHAGGHSERHEFEVPEDVGGMRGKTNKTPIQAYGSTMTYGRRYATLCVFNVPIASQDKDGNRVGDYGMPDLRGDDPLIGEEDLKTLKALMQKADVEDVIILEAFEVGNLAELTVSQCEKAAARCNKKLQLIREYGLGLVQGSIEWLSLQVRPDRLVGNR